MAGATSPAPQGYQGFVNVGKLGETSGIRFQGFYSRDSAQTAGSLPESIFAESPDSNLSAGDYEELWAYQGSVQAYKQFGLAAPRRRCTTGGIAPSGSTSTRKTIRTPSGSATTRASATPPTTAGPRCSTSSTSLSLRGGVDGEVTRVEIDIFADSAKFGARPDVRPPRRGARSGTSRRSSWPT